MSENYIDKSKKSDTAIIVTAYTGENETENYHNIFNNNNEYKRRMTKTMCKYLSRLDHYLILSTHSTIDDETQKYVNAFLYDSDNRWQFDGVPSRPNHGIADVTLIHNAINHLKRFSNIKYILKLCYDLKPDLDYDFLIKEYKSHNKELVTFKNYTDLGIISFFCTIDFFEKTFSEQEFYRCDAAVETAWYSSVKEKGLMDKVYGYSTYEGKLHLSENDILHYSIAGQINPNYNF